MNLKQIIREEIKRQLNESSQWEVGKRVQYKNLRTGKSKINKIITDLGDGKWELDGGHIAYENDPEFKLIELKPGDKVKIKKNVDKLGGKEVEIYNFGINKSFVVVTYKGQNYSVHASDIE